MRSVGEHKVHASRTGNGSLSNDRGRRGDGDDPCGVDAGSRRQATTDAPPMSSFSPSSSSSSGGNIVVGGVDDVEEGRAMTESSISPTSTWASVRGEATRAAVSSSNSERCRRCPDLPHPKVGTRRLPLRRREILAWVVVAAQAAATIAVFSLGHGSCRSAESQPSSTLFGGAEDGAALWMNGRIETYNPRRGDWEGRPSPSLVTPSAASDARHDGTNNSHGISLSTREPYYEPPVIHPKHAGLVQRTWRSNGSPIIHPHLKTGSCWCSADEWCMCTPSIAVDVILRTGPNHIWLVRRADTGKLALMGGMIEVGETAEQAVHRELHEEMNIILPPDNPPILFGVYTDPLRDARRHSASVVYVVDVPSDANPKAGDDAVDVMRIALNDIDRQTFFVDHKTILRDYRAYIMFQKPQSASIMGSELAPFVPDEPVKRSVCPLTVERRV